jgi:alcohol dehydrogenase
MPETMASLTFVRKGRLEWREVPRPVLQGPDEALVRPIVASRCDGDCLFLLHRYGPALALGRALHVIDPEVAALGDPPLAGPFAYGHECVAEVIAIGERVTTVAIGQRVVVPWAISCGRCALCVRGLTSHCERNTTPLAAYGWGRCAGGWGGMVGDLLRVPWADAMLVPIPPGLSLLEFAGASDNIPDAWRAVGPHLRAEPGAPVLVVGGAARSIGLYAAGLAVAMGSSRVDYVDTHGPSLAVAAALGANPIERSTRAGWFRRGATQAGARYPITVDASSRPDGLEYAIRAAAPGGVCTGLGFYLRAGTPLPLWHMFLKDTRLHLGVANPRADLPDVVALIASGRFRPSLVSDRVADWNDAPAALLDRDATKVVLTRDGAVR